MATKKPRQNKTPAQRAQEALGVAERRLKRADDLVNRLGRELREAGIEQDQAKARRDYAAKDPDLVLGVPDGDAAARRTRTTPTASTGANA